MPFGERIGVSFRMENPKPIPQNRPEAGLFRGRYSGRDSLSEGRLEQKRGFEPSALAACRT